MFESSCHIFAATKRTRMADLQFAGHPVTVEPVSTENGPDVLITCTVNLNGKIQRKRGYLSQAQAYIDSKYRYGYFGDIQLFRNGDNIHIGCLHDSIENFNALVNHISVQQKQLV